MPTTRKVATEQTYRVFLPQISKSPRVSKKGLAMAWGRATDTTALNATWCYWWTYNPPPCDNAESVPMVRDQGQWAAIQSGAPIGGNSIWLMGYNEPEPGMCQYGQACVPMADAVRIWREIDTRFPERKLVAPVPSHLYREWIVEFRNAYIATYGVSPRFDALAMHIYSFRANDGIELLNWYEARAGEWGVGQVWVTEFSFIASSDTERCWGWYESDTLPEMRAWLNRLESDSMVARYAFYAPRIDTTNSWSTQPAQCNAALIDYQTGELTRSGRMYLGY